MRFTLCPIYWLSGETDDEQFNLHRLPFDVTEDVCIEAVSQRFRADAFDLGRKRLGTGILEDLEGVRYALRGAQRVSLRRGLKHLFRAVRALILGGNP